ncbi:chemotaxis protein CheW [Aquibacillus koreensis]|uniref:Chemotaxis protein CheW n=1 Tax=Aquibacillus koreensis TaxID=279446 RepID=A0A9X3WLA0_9BACI|nr:chemotaxis protein CheW [Aquibacillus koreensis]MCT2534544.1 chemotaxis protein CheW [Aquibacillus koreensis]MDC3421862.1 chemotaxis protein CheW [Aquibacillus koreensis]
MLEVSEQNVKAIVFELQDEEYAISVKEVSSIERVQHITRVPRAASFVKGVINLRGVVTPIIDLRKRFGMETIDFTDSTRIIIVNINGMEVGLIVDAAYDVIDISHDAIEPPPEVIGTVNVDYIEGVAKLDSRLLMLLKIEKVLSEKEKKELQSVEG